MKTKRLFRILTTLSFLLATLPGQAVKAAPAASAVPSSLLQFAAGGHALGFNAGGMYAATGSHALHVDFAGANAVQPKADSPASANGKAASLSKVTYTDLWYGITLAYMAAPDGIYTTTYTLEPGADPGEIRLRYNAPLTLNEDGTLGIAFETGMMTESAPIAWQEIQGKRVSVDVSFQVNGEEVTFSLGAYDPHQTLTIDPSLVWNTFLGGSGNDGAYAIAMDGSGNIYVTGYSFATWGSPVRPYGGGNVDAFVAKLNSAGASVWNTFLGGSGNDHGYSIAVDGNGNVYVAGDGDATWGSPARAYTGYADAFAAKLNSSTGALTWNTFLGGSGNDYGYGIAVYGGANVYVTGYGLTTWGGPVRAYAGGYDGFVVKLNSSTGALTWNTFLGGGGTDFGIGIAVDGGGNIFVSGESSSTWDSPVRDYAAGYDGFVVKLNSSTGALTWNTFLGGGGTDYGTGIALDGSGNIYVTGASNATWGSPVRAYTSGDDAFGAKLNASTGVLTWNTFLGASGNDKGRGIAVDGSGNVYLSGTSDAAWGSPLRDYSGGYDAFAAGLNSSGTLIINLFLGSNASDDGLGIAASGNYAYVAGISGATWGNPVRAYTSSTDAFVTKVDFNPPGAFNKTAPANAANASTNPTLSWESTNGAESYEYCVDTTNNNACDTSWISTGTAQSVALSGLTNTATYYWQVRANNQMGTTYANGGTWWSFIARTVSFTDVPANFWDWAYIETIYANGITSGCSQSPLMYCPGNPVTREQMAVFILKSEHGSSYVPPAMTGLFTDVPIGYWAGTWIEQLYHEGITAGCSQIPLMYCPTATVTREQMAVFLMKAEHGASYTPPAMTGVFTDVPIGYWAGTWIEQVYHEGITSGCSQVPLMYCPANPVTRDQMAVFLVKTFHLLWP